MAASGGRPVALLLIDLQKTFTEGYWRSGISDEEVAPIKQAFDNCASMLSRGLKDVPLRLTRTPCYGADFELYDSVSEVLPRDQPYFVKPSTSVMHSEGFPEWVQQLLAHGINTLVMGGCTTTSCVRVSSTLTQQMFKQHGLQVIVDLSLCGARLENHAKRCSGCLDEYLNKRRFYYTGFSRCKQCQDTPETELISPLDKAVQDMRAAGVEVVESFDWTPYHTN